MSFERLEDYPGELNDISDTVAELLAKARRTKSKAARGATAANGAAAWSTRLGVAIDKGAPLGAQWNQNEVLVQAYGIPNGSRNVEGAKQFIDFSLSPDVQANW